MTPKLKKIIIITLVVVLLFILYVSFLKPDPAETDLVKEESAVKKTSEEAQALGAQITETLTRIANISLSSDIFSSNIYKSLADRSRPITSEPFGRSNPFAPLSDQSVNFKSNNSISTSTLNATSTNSKATSTNSNATSTNSNATSTNSNATSTNPN